MLSFVVSSVVSEDVVSVGSSVDSSVDSPDVFFVLFLVDFFVVPDPEQEVSTLDPAKRIPTKKAARF